MTDDFIRPMGVKMAALLAQAAKELRLLAPLCKNTNDQFAYNIASRIEALLAEEPTPRPASVPSERYFRAGCMCAGLYGCAGHTDPPSAPVRSAPPPFPDASYEIPLERRLECASQDGPSVPRLGIFGTNKHSVPLTSAEAKQLLEALSRPAPTADTPPLDDVDARKLDQIASHIEQGLSADDLAAPWLRLVASRLRASQLRSGTPSEVRTEWLGEMMTDDYLVLCAAEWIRQESHARGNKYGLELAEKVHAASERLKLRVRAAVPRAQDVSGSVSDEEVKRAQEVYSIHSFQQMRKALESFVAARRADGRSETNG